MSLTFDNKVNWNGHFVSLGDITFQKEVKLKGEEGKDPIHQVSAGGALFHETKSFDDILEMEKLKFQMENVESFKDDVSVKGPTLGVVRNCQNFEKKLDLKDNVEGRIVRSHIKDKLSFDNVRGELLDTQVDDDFSLKQSALIICRLLAKKKLTVENSYFHGSELNISEDFSLNQSFARILKLKCKTLSLDKSELDSCRVTVEDDVSLDDSYGLCVNYSSESLSLQESSFLGHKFTTQDKITVDSQSSLLGTLYEGNITSTGSILLTASEADVEVNDHGFIGVGVTGSSNFSLLVGGVDSLAVPRINNRTRSDFIVEAEKSVFLVAHNNLLAQAQSDLFIDSAATIVNTSHDMVTDVLFKIDLKSNDYFARMSQNYDVRASSEVTIVSDQNTLIEANQNLDLVAGSDNLLRGQNVFAVGDTIPKFSPPDHCIAVGCDKPVWQVGSKSKSINQTAISALTPICPDLPE
jgi:hypothetical protein